MSDLKEEKRKFIRRHYNTLRRGKVYFCPLGNGIKTVPAGMIYSRKRSFFRMKTFLGKNPPFFLTLFKILKTKIFKWGV